MSALYLVTGVANEQSIAWAVAEELWRGGDRCALAVLPRNLRRVEKLVAGAGRAAAVLPLDVRDDASLAALAEGLRALREQGAPGAPIGQGAPLAGVLHSIAHARGEELMGTTLEVSREGFLEAMDVSVYSLLALLRAAEPLLGEGSSVVALSYHGAQKCLPGYNLMGVAKAALESACRYLAHDLGGRGIRVNALSAGPLLTLSSAAFDGIEEKIARSGERAPLGRPTAMADVASAICHLLSARAGGITAQCLYVDNGLSSMGV